MTSPTKKVTEGRDSDAPVVHVLTSRPTLCGTRGDGNGNRALKRRRQRSLRDRFPRGPPWHTGCPTTYWRVARQCSRRAEPRKGEGRS